MYNNENQTQRTSRKDAPRRLPQDKDPLTKLLSSLPFVILLPLTLIFLELIVHIAAFSEMNSSFFAYATFFSLSSGMLMVLLCTLFDKKVNYVISLVIIGGVTVLCAVQVVYSAFFGDFFQLTTVGFVGNLADYMDNTVKVIFANLHWILILFIPFTLFAIFGRSSVAPRKMGWVLRVACAAFAVCFFMLGTTYINSRSDDDGDKYIYGEGFLVKDSIARFGVLTTARLELQYKLFGDSFEVPEETVVINNETTAIKGNDIFGPKDPVTNPPASTTQTPNTGTVDPPSTGGTDETGGSSSSVVQTDPPKPPVVDRSPQRLDIDFESLKADALASKKNNLYNAHVYFENRAGTNKNEYTGLFEGKNLIYITVEGWAPAAINEKLTPTLYMMKNEGFVFENYYNSLWGGSTATGEYANITGNFYYDVNCLRYSAKTYQPFALGNMLSAEGYVTKGFHNHKYDYYGRDISHPNFGYNWFGIGNWSGVSFTEQWPKSDHELGLNTLSEITADKPFHLYYMTVSGHAYQTFVGNRQAAKHRSLVTSLLGNDYKNQASLSFIACQYEVELMVKELYDQCERLGILEDTVFVLAPDHFPYGITEDDKTNQATLAELYGISTNDIYNNPDLYRAPLIIWSGSMKEPVHIDKVCSAVDILPTVLNLFGLEYDSRVIIGQDILDPTSEGFVILNMLKSSHHFITDYGFFNFTTKKFTVADGYTVDPAALDQYVTQMRDFAYNVRKYSPYILDNDYYRIIFGN